MAAFGTYGWTDRGWYDTSLGRQRLMQGRDTPEFREAMRHCGDALRAIGFDDGNALRLNLWMRDDYDHELAALICAEVEAYLPVARERLARRPAEAERALRDLVENRPWLLQPQMLADAERLLTREPFYYSMTVERILEAAAKTEARIQDRLAAPIEPVAGDLVRSIHEALRIVSSSDLDGAKYKNGWGWGKATSTSGHWLSTRSRLTPEQAAHGLKLLRTHRRQLPREIRIRIGL